MSIDISPHSAGGHVLRARMVVPRPIREVFAFFEDPRNLEEITPPFLHFQVLTPEPLVMGKGLLIDYRLRVHGLPLRWRSEITAHEPPVRFVDEQRRGPYRWWIHEHRFEPLGEGATAVIDEVRYAVPGGRLVNWLLVSRDLRRIFAHRQACLERRFGTAA